MTSRVTKQSEPIVSSVPMREQRTDVIARGASQVLLHTVIIAVTAIFIVPIVWLVISSLKLNVEFGAYPIQFLPKTPIWGNYYDALTAIPFFLYMGRSVMLAGTYAVLTVVSSALAGFGFARHRAPGRNTLFILVMAMIMVPGIITVIPQFILYTRLGLVNTYWPWILWGLAGSPFHIFLFRQFFSSFPKDLEDAAEIDGCSRLRLFWQIFMPNAGPVIAASGIFAFQAVWGDFFTPTLFLNDSKATLAMRLATAYVDPRGNPLYTQTMAAIVLFVLPLIAVFFIAQRSIIQGIVTTGSK